MRITDISVSRCHAIIKFHNCIFYINGFRGVYFGGLVKQIRNIGVDERLESTEFGAK